LPEQGSILNHFSLLFCIFPISQSGFYLLLLCYFFCNKNERYKNKSTAKSIFCFYIIINFIIIIIAVIHPTHIKHKINTFLYCCISGHFSSWKKTNLI
jgi:hypothetical protein